MQVLHIGVFLGQNYLWNFVYLEFCMPKTVVIAWQPVTLLCLWDVSLGFRAPNVPKSDLLYWPKQNYCRSLTTSCCLLSVAVFPCEVPGCKEVFSSVLQFDMHYNSCHRFICCQCKKPLPSAHLLDLHISESHDSFFAAQAERKPMVSEK